jgi:hypothetical protein
VKQVWSCGGGTQSAAIACLICEGKLPKPDHALMVDTEREKSSTWRYVFGTIKPRLAEVGVDLIVIPKSEYATVDLYSLKSHDLLIPAYTSTGGKLSTFCSNEWKQRVINRWLRDNGVGLHDAVQWIGFSVNEVGRVRAGKFRYPLILEFPMDRVQCAQYVVSRGWQEPPEGGSACWMCPQMSHRQWLMMREHEPEDFARAVTFDVEIRLQDPDVFVHRSGKPLTEIDDYTDDQQGSLFGCNSGHCMV